MPAEPQPVSTLLLQQQEESRRQRQRTLNAHIQAVKDARNEVEATLRGLQEAAARLRQVVRRNPDESSAQLMVFANGHLRLTGAFSSGIKRTATMDRLVDAAEADRQEAERVEVERQERRRERAQVLSLPEPEDAFEELYGDVLGEVANAE
jgi:hypothetical protein